jgi:hypothetical protein
MELVLVDLDTAFARPVWEVLLLTEGAGLADQLRLPHGLVRDAADCLWPVVCTDPGAQAADWWSALEALVGSSFPARLVAETEAALLGPDPLTSAYVQSLLGPDGQLGIVGDSTSFWVVRQLARLGTPVPAQWRWLSHERRCSKGSGLLELTAADLRSRQLPPAGALFVDERPDDVAKAAHAGFRVRLEPAVQAAGSAVALRTG